MDYGSWERGGGDEPEVIHKPVCLQLQSLPKSCQKLSTMSSFDHKIYKNDPVKLKSYVSKRCSVTTVDKITHTGIIYTIDPVTERLVFYNCARNFFRICAQYTIQFTGSRNVSRLQHRSHRGYYGRL